MEDFPVLFPICVYTCSVTVSHSVYDSATITEDWLAYLDLTYWITSSPGHWENFRFACDYNPHQQLQSAS